MRLVATRVTDTDGIITARFLATDLDPEESAHVALLGIGEALEVEIPEAREDA